MKYSKITVIYNPNSTGSSELLAQKFKTDLLKKDSKQNVHLQATEYAGHAEKLAYELAQTKNSLIISSSGDGGYNEVVNGAMRAKHEGHETTVGLLPAGNANDHFHNLHTTDTVELVIKGQSKNIDVLTLESTSEGKPVKRYGHSYIGFGVTPVVGNELNKKDLNRINEVLIVAKTLFTLRSIKLIVQGKQHHYESIVFSNVDKMSKYLKISKPAAMDDGKFEVTTFYRKQKLQFIRQLISTTITPAKEDAKVSHYVLKTVDKTLVQVDGEVMTLDAGTDVTIGIEQKALRCIV